jgi:protein-tyrosine phosphatase
MERLIELEGCHNFRDLGGYPAQDGKRVRWRMLFRSDGLHLLSTADVTRLQNEIGLGHMVDLRSSGELRIDGVGPLADASVEHHHVPLFDGEMLERREIEPITLADRYFLMAEFAKEPIARVLTTLAGAEKPAVYHCAAGKDRTGVISAVLLGVLGVRDEVIVADYAATQQNLDAIIERLMSSEGYQEMLSALPEDTLHAEPATMISLLERVRERYGSMREYALSIGVSEADVARIEDRLLE